MEDSWNERGADATGERLAGPIPDSYWLIDNVLLAGRYPGAMDEDEARDKLTKFLDAGIRTFINLTETSEPLARYDDLLRSLSAERGIQTKHIRVSIQDRSVPNSRELMTRILTTIREEIAARRPVYVHCWGGIGRTGTVIGCWLAENGMAGSAAIERIAQLRAGTPDRERQSPEMDSQCRFVCDWTPGGEPGA